MKQSVIIVARNPHKVEEIQRAIENGIPSIAKNISYFGIEGTGRGPEIALKAVPKNNPYLFMSGFYFGKEYINGEELIQKAATKNKNIRSILMTSIPEACSADIIINTMSASDAAVDKVIYEIKRYFGLK